jgi:hypothetical protein
MIEQLQRYEEDLLAAVSQSIPNSVMPVARLLTKLGGVREVWSCVLGAAALAAIRRRSLAAFLAPVGTLAAAAGSASAHRRTAGARAATAAVLAR